MTGGDPSKWRRNPYLTPELSKRRAESSHSSSVTIWAQGRAHICECSHRLPHAWSWQISRQGLMEHSKILWWRSPSLVFIASLLAAWFSTLAPINPQRSSTIPGDSCQNSAIRAIWEWFHAIDFMTWGHCNSSNRYVDCIETHRPNSTWGVIKR